MNGCFKTVPTADQVPERQIIYLSIFSKAISTLSFLPTFPLKWGPPHLVVHLFSHDTPRASDIISHLKEEQTAFISILIKYFTSVCDQMYDTFSPATIQFSTQADIVWVSYNLARF
jgi:hypothetical protein